MRLFVLIVIGLLYSAFQPAMVLAGCDFDPKGIKVEKFYDRLKSGELTQFEWDKIKYKGIAKTKGDDVLNIKYYACNSFGVDATMRSSMQSNKITRKFIENKFILFGKIIFDQYDLEKIKKEIDIRFNEFFNDGVYNGKDIEGVIDGAGYATIEYAISLENNHLIIKLISFVQ